MAEEVVIHRVWAEGAPVEPGLLRFAHFEIADVKYVDVHLYGVDDALTYRATMRLKGNEIDDLVMALIRDVSETHLIELGNAALEVLDQDRGQDAGLHPLRS
jgi:hypothetical protein